MIMNLTTVYDHIAHCNGALALSGSFRAIHQVVQATTWVKLCDVAHHLRPPTIITIPLRSSNADPGQWTIHRLPEKTPVFNLIAYTPAILSITSLVVTKLTEYCFPSQKPFAGKLKAYNKQLIKALDIILCIGSAAMLFHSAKRINNPDQLNKFYLATVSAVINAWSTLYHLNK